MVAQITVAIGRGGNPTRLPVVVSRPLNRVTCLVVRPLRLATLLSRANSDR